MTPAASMSHVCHSMVSMPTPVATIGAVNGKIPTPVVHTNGDAGLKV